jgi:hypothetical protein
MSKWRSCRYTSITAVDNAVTGTPEQLENQLDQ